MHKDDTNESEDGGFLWKQRLSIETTPLARMSVYLEHLLVVVLGDTVHVRELQIRAGCWDEVLITLNRARGLVVKMMRVAPCEVRDEEESVQRESDGGVDPALSRNDTMTSLDADKIDGQQLKRED